MGILPETKRRSEALRIYPGGYESLYKELVLFTASRMHRLSIHIDGKTYNHPQDIVSEAIARWLACSRKKNKRIVSSAISPNEISTTLKSIIDSLIKNEGSKLQRNNTFTVEYDDHQLQSDTSVEETEQAMEEDRVIRFVEQELDTVSSQVVECILKKNIVAYRQIAKELGITDSKVRTAKANIKKLMDKTRSSQISEESLEIPTGRRHEL